MAAAWENLELLGVTILATPPIGRVHIPLPEAALTLYGVNGAGKTRILHGVRAALDGSAPAEGQVLLHVRFDAREAYDFGWSMQLVEGVRDGALRARSTADDFRSIELAEAPVEHWGELNYGMSELLVEHLNARLACGADDLVFDLLRRDLPLRTDAAMELVLVPTGDVSAGWSIFAGADMSTGRGYREAFQSEVTAFVQRSSGLQADSSAGLFRGNRETWFSDDELVRPRLVAESAVGMPDTLTDWPAWASMPVMRLGHTDRLPFTAVDSMVDGDWPQLDSMTMDLLHDPLLRVEEEGGLIEALAEEDVVFRATVVDLVQRLEERSAGILSDLLPSDLQPRFLLGHPNDWLWGRPPHWVIQSGRDEVPVASLSWAERRWLTVAVSVALADVSPRVGCAVLLADEPERGLHRGAESRLAQTVARLAKSGVPSVLATHSPALLNDPRLAVGHVARNAAGRTTLASQMPSFRSDRDRELLADQLGLTLADLYQLTRVFVLVEGPHDRALLETLLGDDLDAAFARILPINGAKQLTAMLNAPMIFDYTDAKVLLVLDNLVQETMAVSWARFRDAASRGDAPAATKLLNEIERLPGGEAKWLRDMAEAAWRQGQLHRIGLCTLSEPDIICYLPPQSFNQDLSDTWAELLTRWREISRATGRRHDLKDWLRTSRAMQISVSRVRKGAEQMARSGQPMHPDLQALGLRIREAAASRIMSED